MSDISIASVSQRPCFRLSEHDSHVESWEKLKLGIEKRLSDRDRQIAETLEKRAKIEILELREGIRIKTNSRVGHVAFDAFDLVVRPKFDCLDVMPEGESPLAVLLAYAFDWNHLKKVGYQISSEVYFAEILIHGLLEEARNIRHRGPFQQYHKERKDLSVLRGKIDLATWLQRGGIPSATMPCVFYRRSLDNILSQTLCAGLRRSAAIAKTPALKSECHFLADTFARFVTEKTLDRQMIADAFRKMNRLNAHYKAAMRMIRMLHEGFGGFTHGKTHKNNVQIPGFFFEMNTLFEKVIEKFLKENLPSDYDVKCNKPQQIFSGFQDETLIPVGHKWRKKPDFAIKIREKRIVIDAKYFTIEQGQEPLDQLCLYALAFSKHSEKPIYRSTALFPDGNNQETKPWQVTMHHYNEKINNFHSAKCVITLRPINMQKLVELIKIKSGKEKEKLALQLIGE